ncbi:MAG: FecR domain-containing protein, partial [Planctomycetaceae bacterium]|nr:FecR domain-containing protein [Planctomycetaceae bacterium]
LWSRLISGNAVTADEEQRLKDASLQDAELRAELATDATVHALLRSVSDVQQTQEDFIAQVLTRCQAPRKLTGEAGPQGDRHSSANTEPSGLMVTAAVGTAKPSPASGMQPDSDTLAAPGTPHDADTPHAPGPSHHAANRSASPLPLLPAESASSVVAEGLRRRRTASPWSAWVLTTMLFGLLASIIWMQRPDEEPTANSDTRPAERESRPQDLEPVGPLPGDLVATPNTLVTEADNAPAAGHLQQSPETPGTLDSPRAQESPGATEMTDPETIVVTDDGDRPMDGPGQDPLPGERLRGLPGNVSDSEPALATDVGVPSPFVTLTRVEDPVWERDWKAGDRMASEIVRLFGGTLELTFDDGAVVSVDGPIEFRPLSTGELQLRRGRLQARVPARAIGFKVSTPTSDVVDLGTEFEVTVSETGASDVVVRKGEIEVTPAGAEGEKIAKWRLVPSQMSRASFFARPDFDGTSPVSASVQGAAGQFHGVVSVNGQTAEFTSPEAFEQVRNRVITEFGRSRQDAMRQWQAFVTSMQNSMRGSMNLNGREVQFGNLQEIMRLQQQMLNNPPNGTTFNDSNFSGSINVNGKVITFRTREEYEAARRAAFGPAATFGAGDVFEGRRLPEQKSR